MSLVPSINLAVMAGGTDLNNSASQVSRETVIAMQELTKAALSRNDPALVWGVDLFSLLGPSLPFTDIGHLLPNVEVGNVLLNHCLMQPTRGLVWAYLQHGLAARILCPLLTLSILTARVIPMRQQQPEMYQIYLEITNDFILLLGVTKNPAFRERCMKYVDEALQFSQMGEAPVTEFGTCIAYFLFCLVNRLTDAIAEDWNSPPTWNEKQKISGSGMHGQMTHGVNEMEDDVEEKRREEKEHRKKANSLLALDLVAKIMQNKRTSTLLRLARRTLPDQWGIFARTLHALEVFSRNPMSSAPKEAPDALGNLATAIQQGLHREWRPTHLPVIQAMLDSGSRSSMSANAGGVGSVSPWLPLDIYMESALEKQRLHVKSPSDCIADMMRTLQAVQGGSWTDVFLGAWTAALRLTQRNREWMEGPRPQIESRMCMLLSHMPLACITLVEEEEKGLLGGVRGDSMSSSIGNGDDKDKGVRRAAVVLSLQALGQFESLLHPPKIAVLAANQAAASIAGVLANLNASAGMGSDPIAQPKVTVGNMRHLIVEACIARGLLDTSSYFWLAKTGTGGSLSAPSPPPQSSPWTAFMEGTPLSASLQAALISNPAESLAELEKVYQMAITGPDEERSVAASILCGASLQRSWNFQEHAVRLAVRLLSPPSSDNRGSGSHLIAYGSMLFATLDAITSADTLNILSLYGMFPELAASLLPICEVFGSLAPSVPRGAAGSGEDVYKIFSLAFLLLVRLWKFYRPPLEHCLLGSGPGLGADLSLEYLLQIRTMQQSSSQTYGDKVGKESLLEPIQNKRMSPLSPNYSHSISSIRSPLPSTPSQVSQNVTLDSFPKLKAWYTQHQACIASTLASLARGNPVHQVADRLLNIMFKKSSKNTSGTNSSNSGGHSGGDEKPSLPAWDVVAAVPLVVDEVLNACSHGQLSPRDLTTGLRDMIDFLPATLASFVSCCGAEIYRGLYKPASMNGSDWPSPASNLFAVEAEIQDILASAGVHIPSLVTGTVGGNAPASLPLPLAALVSLTITFKLDRQSEIALGVAGPALESASAGGPWPSMAVVAALWSQKMRRWHDHILFNATRAIFKQSNHSVSQLLRSCFLTVLGTSPLMSKLQTHGGIGALLGHGYWFSTAPAVSAVAPGMLYLKSFSTLHDIMFVSDELLALVAESSRELAAQGLPENDVEATPNVARLGCAHPSLSTAIARAVQASTLGASFLTVSGGETLARKLYLESLPTWLLSGFGSQTAKSDAKGSILEGYAVARFVLLSGAMAWGISSKTMPSSSHFGGNSGIPFDMHRQHVLSTHLEFVASGLDGKISIRCKSTWKGYVTGFLALMVTCTPNWILDIKFDTLNRLATGLRWWQHHDLAFALLERGGPIAAGAAAELAMGYN